MSEIKGGDGVPIIDKQQKTNITSFLQPILDKELTVEDIDNYAFVAVDGLVSLVNQKVDEYKAAHGTTGWDDKTIEDRALEFYGLEDVGTYLDFLDKKDEEIRNLDRVIKRTVHKDQVIIPPDEAGVPAVKTGNGEGMENKKMINRTKAILFILKEDFDVDVDNEGQLTLVDGVVRDNMMRNTSYVLIKAPTIERTILVCNEEGNASYVFNNEVLEKQNISDETLVDFTKTDLNALITETPELGKRVIYSKTGFVPRIIDAIKHPESTRPDEVTDKMKNTGKYLYPKASDGELSCSGLVKKLGVAHSAIVKIISQIDPVKLGKVEKRRFRSNVVPAYTLEQQELISKAIENQGLLLPLPRDGELSYSGLARKLGVDSHLVAKIIEQIDPIKLGEIKERKFTSVVAPAYTLKQQEIIIQAIEDKGVFLPPPEETQLSSVGLAKKIGITFNALERLMKKIDLEELGKVEERKFGSRVGPAYTPEQQEIIIKKAREVGLLALPPKEGELSRTVLARNLGILKRDLSTFAKIIDQIDTKELGKVEKRKFRSNTAPAYTPEQQEIIKRYVDEWRKKRNKR